MNLITRLFSGAVLMAPLSALSQNLVVNGDFSAGNTGFTTQYTLSSSLFGEGVYFVGFNPNDHHSGGASFFDHTTGNGRMLIVNGHPTSNMTMWQQTIAVTANTIYDFSGWTASWGLDTNGRDPSPGRLLVTVNGVQITPTFGLNPAPGAWTQFLGTWASGSSTSAILRIVDENTVRIGNDFAVDDLNFYAVPEPASLLAVGIGLVVLLRKRRA